MIRYLFLVFCVVVSNAMHFNGGTIRWEPTDPYDNSSSITISIIQTYWWTYPLIKCANNVPSSTAGRSTQYTNLTCVVDCTTDGNYSSHPISTLTDCVSVSASAGFLTSERSVNTTLFSGAHFYLAFVGSAWVGLNYPAQYGLEWSIVTFIDLRMRPDGFINTPPVASIISPLYAIVNRTMQIEIPVSDVNAGDDVRCRWAVYISGYRRRKRSNEEYINEERTTQIYKRTNENEEIILVRNRRVTCGTPKCSSGCGLGCDCNCSMCLGMICNGLSCGVFPYCLPTTTTSTTTTTTTTTETTTTTTTTFETPGILKSTSSYPVRQAINECGGICYPGSMPSGTTLSNCTLTFTGMKANTWYAVAIQVEDFLNTTDTTPMSSVPVQFLIYVLPEPACSEEPMITPLSDCLEVSVGVSRSFVVSVLNYCNVNVSNVTTIIASQGITGMQVGNLTQSSANASSSSVTLLWTPQANQIGLQQLCLVAYTSEHVQSAQYCVTFTVLTSLDICKTTTTTSTSTTETTATTATTTTTSTATTTSATTSSTTSATTTTTTSTTTTITTTSATTTSTSSTSTTTSSTKTTSTSISTTTTSTSSTSTTTISTSTTTTSTSTTTTSTSTTTTSTSTTTTSTSTTTTSITTANIVAVATTSTASSGNGISWGLIAGILSVSLPLALCTFCCLYLRLWSPQARRRRAEREDRLGYNHLTSSTENVLRTTTPNTTTNAPIEVPRKSYQVYNILSPKNSPNTVGPPPESEGSILVAIYNNTNAKRANTEESFEMGNAWMHPSNDENSITRRATLVDSTSIGASNVKTTSESFHNNRQTRSTLSSPSFNAFQSSSAAMSGIEQDHSFRSKSLNFTDWTRLYLFGNKPDTGLPRMPRSS